MKEMLMAAVLVASFVAYAGDQKAVNVKADDDVKRTDHPTAVGTPMYEGDDAKAKRDGVKETELTQSQLLDKLHQVAVGHTELGNLAQTRAKSDRVKQLGERMARDFVRLDQQLIDHAKENDLVLSDATGMFERGAKRGAKKGEELERLGKLQGAAFDEAYLTAVDRGCEKLIPVLEGAKGKFDDASFDRILAKTLDTLKGYQKDARKLRKDYAPAS